MAAASAPVLNLFWDLASTDTVKRLEASTSLVAILTEHQEAAGGSACGDLAYTVRRLVRGLASSRDGASSHSAQISARQAHLTQQGHDARRDRGAQNQPRATHRPRLSKAVATRPRRA